MKNIFSYKEFLVEKNQLNEGFWGWLKGMFKSLQEYAKKIKESGEIDKKINLWKTELDKLIDEKVADIKQSEGQKPAGKENENYLYEAEEVKKEVLETMPDFIKTLGKEKSTGNAIDDAINQFLDNRKAELMPYINSDNKSVRLYVYAKIAELNTHILNKKIEIYKANKAKQKELKEAENKLKAISEEAKNIQKDLKQALDNKTDVKYEVNNDVLIPKDKESWDKLDDNKKKDEIKKGKESELLKTAKISKIDGDKVTIKTKDEDGKEIEEEKTIGDIVSKIESKPGEIETGKIYRYTNKKGQVSNVYLKKDGTAVTTSEKGDKEPGEPIDKPNIKDTFKPITTKLKPQENKEKRKTMGYKLKTAGLDKIDPENV